MFNFQKIITIFVELIYDDQYFTATVIYIFNTTFQTSAGVLSQQDKMKHCVVVIRHARKYSVLPSVEYVAWICDVLYSVNCFTCAQVTYTCVLFLLDSNSTMNSTAGMW